VVTETEERFEQQLKKLDKKIGESKVIFNDAQDIYNLCCNLLIHYQNIRKSREQWKEKYRDLLKKHRELEYEQKN